VNNRNQQHKIDAVIPCHSKDRDTVELCIKGCRKNIIGLRNIYLITNDVNMRPPGVTTLDENKLFGNEVTKDKIETRWKNKCPENADRAGWLFQQFLKLGSCYTINDLTENYIILDSDVTFLKKVHFFEGDKILISPSNEYHKPYFDFYERLFDKPADREWPFVSHHIPVRKTLLKEFIKAIEKRTQKKWYDVILDNIDYKKRGCFSEYETFGHYLKKHHPEKLQIRKLSNIQSFK